MWQNGRITRGYTGHEQLDPIGLVHMNGRVYDPELGRFLSADPFIQDATNLQALNAVLLRAEQPPVVHGPVRILPVRAAEGHRARHRGDLPGYRACGEGGAVVVHLAVAAADCDLHRDGGTDGRAWLRRRRRCPHPCRRRGHHSRP